MSPSEKVPASDERLDAVNDNIRLLQKKNGLTYGTDAYLLAAYLRPAHRARAADLGTGTGIIPLLAQSRGKFSHVYAVEIQACFAELTKRNIAENGMTDKITVLHRDVTTLSPTDFGGELDVVFSNPPYMTTGSGKRNEADEKYIARHEVCGSIYDFCTAASRILRYGGAFYVVYRPDRMADLFDALHRADLSPKRMTLVQSDTETPPSMLLLEAKKGASTGLVLDKTLLLYRDGATVKPRRLTDRAAQIYETCSF